MTDGPEGSLVAVAGLLRVAPDRLEHRVPVHLADTVERSPLAGREADQRLGVRGKEALEREGHDRHPTAPGVALRAVS